MKRSLVLFFAAAALCILCACGANEAAPAAVIVNETASPAPTPTATPRPTATPAPVELYGGTWRYDEDYYDMRDAFHMYYMDIEGNTVERMTEDELAAVHKKYWGY